MKTMKFDFKCDHCNRLFEGVVSAPKGWMRGSLTTYQGADGANAVTEHINLCSEVCVKELAATHIGRILTGDITSISLYLTMDKDS